MRRACGEGVAFIALYVLTLLMAVAAQQALAVGLVRRDSLHEAGQIAWKSNAAITETHDVYAASLVRQRDHLETGPYLSLHFEPSASNFSWLYSSELKDFVLRTINLQVPLEWRTLGVGQRPLLWLHIHKMAGSFTCAIAAANGERIVAPSENCNWLEHDHFWGVSGIGRPDRKQITCIERAAYFRQWKFTFGMIEREMTDADFCSQFRYGTVLREPLSYLSSILGSERAFIRQAAEHFGFKLDNNYNLTAFLRSAFDFASPNGVAPRSPEHEFGIPGWKFLDNFMIRIILGSGAFNLGRGRINKTHLDRAIQRLQEFDVVHVIRPTNGWTGLSPQVGWNLTTQSKVNVGQDDPPSDETTTLLKQLNRYDVKLFEYFEARGSSVQ